MAIFEVTVEGESWTRRSMFSGTSDSRRPGQKLGGVAAATTSHSSGPGLRKRWGMRLLKK